MTIPPRGRGFATTRWTLVMAARRESADARFALSELCELYWPPIYSYARRRGYSIEEAEDATQGFFTRFLEKRDVEDADPSRGRFRSFLLSSFKHFLANRYDQDRAKKRGGDYVLVSLDVKAAEAQYVAEPADTLTPDALYEQQWARGVLARAHTALRAELVKAGKTQLLGQIEDLLVGDKAERGVAEAARSLGMSDGALRVMIHRLRRRLLALLRLEILATVSDESEAEDEIRYLIGVLATRRNSPAGS